MAANLHGSDSVDWEMKMPLNLLQVSASTQANFLDQKSPMSKQQCSMIGPLVAGVLKQPSAISTDDKDVTLLTEQLQLLVELNLLSVGVYTSIMRLKNFCLLQELRGIPRDLDISDPQRYLDWAFSEIQSNYARELHVITVQEGLHRLANEFHISDIAKYVQQVANINGGRLSEETLRKWIDLDSTELRERLPHFRHVSLHPQLPQLHQDTLIDKNHHLLKLMNLEAVIQRLPWTTLLKTPFLRSKRGRLTMQEVRETAEAEHIVCVALRLQGLNRVLCAEARAMPFDQQFPHLQQQQKLRVELINQFCRQHHIPYQATFHDLLPGRWQYLGPWPLTVSNPCPSQ